MNERPYRQIHLDFHTSPFIPDVGAEFDANQFIETLKKNHINSINLFAKCHHGYYYYPTKIGKVHPNLKPGLDLFGEQVAVCRKAGVRVGAYTTVVWSEETCDSYPQWMQVDANGVIGAKAPFSGNFNSKERSWRSLCMNNAEYVAYLKREFKEIYELYNPDSFWIDIILQFGCICPSCRASMKQLGMNPTNSQDVKRHDRLVEIAFSKEIQGYLKSLDPKLEIYFNGCPAEFDMQDILSLSTARRRECNDFIDIESLPSEVWGYTHFPVLVNYSNKYDKPITMMNGKFHKTWGDFGSLRNKAALEYECYRALANGSGICVGDQLHPSGKIDETVYARIGEVFAEIEKKEPWCINTRKISQIAVYAANEVESDMEFDATAITINSTNEGVTRILTELNHLFDFVDFCDDISGYDLVILPDTVRLPASETKKLSAYIKNGGKVILTGESGLHWDKDEFALEEMGLEYVGMEEHVPTYAALSSDVFPKIPSMNYVLYQPGTHVKAIDAKTLAYLVDSYFNRDYERFCSHRQTPPKPKVSNKPFITRNNDVMYITHPLFNDYVLNGCLVYKDLIAFCINNLLSNPIITSDLPSTGEITLRENDENYILHLLHYVPIKRCKTIEIIEDVYPLYDKNVLVRLNKEPKKAYLAPSKEPIDFKWVDGIAEIKIKELNGHQMIVFEK